MITKIKSTKCFETETRATDKRRNPTSRVETELQKKLLELKKQESLTESEYWKLRPSESTPAALYGPPKVHKVNLQPTDDHLTLPQDTVIKIPLRPINSCIGSPTYELLKYLASILKLLQNNNEYSVKNAKEYADFVNNQTMEADEQIVSFDVTALFTSIPVDLALDIVDRKLREIHEWQLHTRLTQSQSMFLLTNSYFAFEGTHYHQVFGRAMGSPVSATIAELMMQEVEKIALNTSNVKPRWWKRYVDDSSSCLKTKDIQVFHDHLNSINPNIQFTVELPSVSSQNH